MAQDILGPTWTISQEGLNIITENDTIKDKTRILKNALDSDLKEIGGPTLSKIATTNNISQVVLQIQKIRNISAPKANENSQTAPRMLKLVLTDGDSYIQAIEKSPITSINRDKTPPGTKILIKSAKITSGYLLLDSNNCSLLGGKVAALVEKWELAKSIQYHNRQNSSQDGPPAWVNFGCKIKSEIGQDKAFKSLDNKDVDIKENSKFDVQRQDAIAEATSGAIKKVFGGGVKQPIQSNPPTNPQYRKPNDFNKDKRNSKINNKFNNFATEEVEERPQKPSERVSLFDFLENKLPTAPPETNNTQHYSKPDYNKPAYNNNQKYSQNNQKYSQNNQNYQQNNRNRPNNNYNYKQHYKNEATSHYAQPAINTTAPPKETKPTHNNDINNLANNLSKMEINNQFATRSLRQHLNLGPPSKEKAAPPTTPSTNSWKVNDECLAKYWEDGKLYNAIITAVTDKTYVVKFKGYGNIEEVLKTDCLPLNSKPENHERRQQQHSGTMEFRRSSKTYRRQ